MSVVIIVGGGKARNAIEDLEKASLGMSQTDRDAAEAFLAEFENCIKAYCGYGTPLPIMS